MYIKKKLLTLMDDSIVLIHILNIKYSLFG